MLVLGLGCVMTAFLYYRVFKSYIYPGVVFNGMWGLLLITNAINPFGYYEVHAKSIVIVSIGILAFNAGCILMRNNILKFRGFHFTKKHEIVPLECNDLFAANAKSTQVSDKVIRIISFTMFLMLLLMLVRLIPYMSTSSGSQLRRIYTTGFFPDGRTFMSTFERLLYIHYGVMPAVDGMFYLAVIMWFFQKIKGKTLLLPILNLTISAILTGGRMTIFNGLMAIIAAQALSKKIVLSSKTKKYAKRALKIALILAVGYAVYNTVNRSVNGEFALWDFIASVIAYFTTSLHLFDITLENPVNFGLEHLTWGLTSFAGLTSFLFYISYIITLGQFTIGVGNGFAEEFLRAMTPIGPGDYFNAFPTMMYFHYRDFGIIGVILGAFLLSVVASHLYNKSISSDSILTKTLFLPVLNVVLMSVCWWDPYRCEFWATLIWSYVFFNFCIKRNEKIGRRR